MLKIGGQRPDLLEYAESHFAFLRDVNRDYSEFCSDGKPSVILPFSKDKRSAGSDDASSDGLAAIGKNTLVTSHWPCLISISLDYLVADHLLSC